MTVRINQPALGSNYHITKISQNNPVWFVATELGGNSLLEVRELGSISNAEHRLFFSNPSVMITTDTHQKEFKKLYNISIKIEGVTDTAYLKTSLQVFNYKTIIEEK